MICPHCTAAQSNWLYGGVDPHCRGCLIRETAQAPRMRRELFYEREMEQSGPRAMDQLKAAVKAEQKRIQELRTQLEYKANHLSARPE